MRNRIAAALALAALSACSGDHLGTAGGGTRILLTDAPFPYDEVSRVDVFIVSVAATTNGDTSSAQEWTTLVEPNRVFNLLDVQNGATALLGETSVPAGQYEAIRMVIRTDLSGITLNDGSPAAVSWLGGATQTINALVEQPLSITTDGSGDLIIDFDVGRSFVGTPGTGFQFLPWIRAVNADATGSISGVVTGANGAAASGPVANASISVYRAGGANTRVLTATGVTDDQGRYTIRYISGGGPHIVEASPPSGFQASAGYSAGVDVTPGQTTIADVVLGQGTGAQGQLRISGPTQVEVGTTITLAAYVFGSDGDSVYGAPVTWQNLNPDVAQIEGSGSAVLVRGLAIGAATIIATSNELADTAVVTVGEAGAPVATVTVVPDSIDAAVGDSIGLRAEARDAIGNLLSDREVAWSVDSGVVNVEATFTNYVILRAVAPGTTTLRAIVEGKEGRATITVH